MSMSEAEMFARAQEAAHRSHPPSIMSPGEAAIRVVFVAWLGFFTYDYLRDDLPRYAAQIIVLALAALCAFFDTRQRNRLHFDDLKFELERLRRENRM